MANSKTDSKEIQRKFRKKKKDSYWSSDKFNGPQGAYLGNVNHTSGAPLNTILADERKAVKDHNLRRP